MFSTVQEGFPGATSVLIVTDADHSTPAIPGRHTRYPVPVLIHARIARWDNEEACGQKALGLRPAYHLMGLVMGLALAHTGRWKKFGPEGLAI